MCKESRKLAVVAVIVVLWAGSSLAQPPDTLWTRTYGGTNEERGFSVQQTSDGGYIVAGHTRSFGAGGWDVYLVKTDANGDTLWTRTYGGTQYEEAYSVKQTSDGGYVVAGYTKSFGAGGMDVYVVKTDAGGDTLWTRAYGGTGDDRGWSVEQTSDGGYIVAGHTNSFGAGGWDVYLLKTDASGDTLWTRTYGGPAEDDAPSVRQTSDAGYIIAGYTGSFGAGGQDVYVVKTDASGDTLWTRTYGGTGDDRGWSVEQTSDGGYIVAGHTRSFGAGSWDVYLLKTDANGDTLWTKAHGGPAEDAAYSVQQTSDAGYIIVGYTGSFGAGWNDVYLLKTDANGDTLWTRTYGASGHETARTVRQTFPDGGYVIAAQTGSFGAGGTDIWVVKVKGFTIVCDPDPQELTNLQPVKTVDVNYLGGGGGLIYGYSMKFSWDGTLASTAPGEVTEGSLLSDQGTTQFFTMTSGTDEITVDCVLLGDQPGVTGPGTMFTIEFTGLACGVSDVDITVIKVRDKDNNALSGFHEDDGELIVDMVNPVFTINGPWPDGQCYNVAPVLDLSASDACGDLDDAFYRVDGGGWTTDPSLFTDYSGSVWTNPAWTLPGFAGLAEGPHLLEFYCTDDVGNSSAIVGWNFVRDTVDPLPVTDFDAAPGNEKVHLSWTNPGGGPVDFDRVIVVRKPWSGTPADAYPEYVQPADGYPTGPGDGAVVYNGAGSSYDDPVVDRSIYYYRAFVYDCAGNYNGGTAPGGDIPPQFAQGDRATNYWLGDVTGPTGYDGEVTFLDVSSLSACYWLYSPGTPPGSPHNECDVGPSDDNSRLGLPVPDDYIDFEDLMNFAMNYGVVTPLGAPVLEREEIGPVVLRLEAAGVAGDEFTVSLVLSGNVDEVKGVSIVLEYDAASIDLKSIARSEEMSSGLVFFNWNEAHDGEIWLDLAALGTGQAIHGSGELARLAFAVKGSRTEVTFSEVILRGVDNKPVDVVTEAYEPDAVPSLTRLLGVRPNPSAPQTTVHYELSRSEHTVVEIYDARGRLVRLLVDGILEPGVYSEIWDGLDSRGNAVHAGIYFVKMRAGSYESTSKLVKVR